MATYTVHKSFIQVIGPIWMPPVICAMQYDLGEWEMGHFQTFTREGVEVYLSSRSGDFQCINDFYADLYDPVDKKDYVIPWADPESEYTFNECMYPSEE
jgi:hypothetical protein